MRIQLLDGGMGTTLEALGHDVSGELWGCELVREDPGVIKDVHDRFAQAGADIIETATWMTREAIEKTANVNSAEAEKVMRRAVGLASGTGKQVALSLGPLGAMLNPGQEYAGFYPPPYGPRGYSPNAPNINYDDDDAEQGFEDALMSFHYDRLSVYATDKKTWQSISWLALETIPVLREIRAIRRAVGKLNDELDVSERKLFWIASAFPDGQHGQLNARGNHVAADAVVAALLDPLPDAPQPDGLGFNCTHPSHLASLVQTYETSLRHRAPAHKPQLLLYPDGGAVYDVVTKTWTERECHPEQWAEQVLRVARGASEDVWAGVIVGGCCKSGFEEIAALRRLIR